MRHPEDFPDSINDADDLDEDIKQTKIGDYCVDIGWYPPHDLSGHFVGRIIKDCNWEKPVEEIITRDLKTIKDWHYYSCLDLYCTGKLDDK